MSKKKLFLSGIALIIITAMLTTTGIYYLLGFNNMRITNSLRFIHALRFIDSQFVDNVDDDKLINGAISGMMSSLNDPHSVYLDKNMYKELMQHTEGSFGGVGIVMSVKDKKLIVISPIEGTPGAEMGIKSGDKIVKIDGESTIEMSIEEAAKRIRGEIGTKVILTIQRDGEEDKEYEVTRASIEVKTVAGKMLDNNIAYIRISSFSEHTGRDFEKIYKEMQEQGMKGIILDLRDNPGGLLTASAEIANYFIPKGTIVSTIKRDGTKEVLKASKFEQIEMPAAVLINGGSASASEIVSGAIQDTGSGTLVGTKSYGKGSVQVVMPMYGGDAIKLTIAKYYTPNDRCIDGIGIEPDVNIEFDGKTDNQLAKAIEIVKEKIQK